jgi:RNA polymerase sigma-70 factor (ECF subfamily)
MSRRPNPENNIALSMQDSHTLNRLTLQNYPALYQYALRLTGNRTQAEDITQEALLRACRGFRHYDTARPFRQWLFRIAHNLYVDNIRSRKMPLPVSLDAMLESNIGDSPIALEVADSSNDPQRTLLEQTLDERLEKALNTLPQEFRSAIILCDIEGMSYEEVSAQLNCSIGTVRSRIHRGRKLLRRALSTPTTPHTERKRTPAAVFSFAPMFYGLTEFLDLLPVVALGI